MQYRMRADNAAKVYSQLKTDFPHGSFPNHAAKVFWLGRYAEAWGEIATLLCGGKTNYIENWRTGK